MAFQAIDNFLKNEAVKAVERVVRPALEKELTDQGHVMTGALKKSIEFRVASSANLVIEGLFLKYGQALETGVPAKNVPFSIPGRARTSKYIAGLTRFVQLRRINASPFAIARTHKKTGIPSPGAFKFSKNGRRTEWVTFGLQAAQPELSEAINTALTKVFDTVVTNEVINKILK